MFTKKKEEISVARNSSTATVVTQRSTLTLNRSESNTRKAGVVTREAPHVPAKLLPYVPPDVLMFDLFSAIQHRAWTQARKLCYELILCDPLRKNYRDLYGRLDQIIKLQHQCRRPRQIATRTITSVTNTSDQKPAKRG